MQHSRACTNLVELCEGCVLTAYPDPGTGADPWTIGWGATGPGIKQGVVWTHDQANTRLDADLSAVDAEVTTILGSAKTTQNQFDALVDFAYNLGAHALAGSTLMKLHKAGDYKNAALEFGKWDQANHHVLQGLVKRRALETALYSKV